MENRPQVQTPPPSSVDNTEDSGDDQYIYDEDDLRLTFMVLNLNVQLYIILLMHLHLINYFNLYNNNKFHY